MSETKLTSIETEVVRQVLQALVIRDRTGEVGLAHGLDRFVRSSLILRRPEREALDQVATKVGLPGIQRRSD